MAHYANGHANGHANGNGYGNGTNADEEKVLRPRYNRIPGDSTPLQVVQQLHAKVPTADKEGFIAIDPEPEELQAFDYLIRHLAGVLSERDFETVTKAYVVASYAHRDQRRQSGEPYMIHPLAVTTILYETLHMDVDTLAAGLLHDVGRVALLQTIEQLRVVLRVKRKRTFTVAGPLALAATALTLSACNTIRGVGRDVGAAGDAIEDAAD